MASDEVDGTGIMDNYIDKLGTSLRFMKPGVRKDILAEVRSHLHDSAVGMGGLTTGNMTLAVKKYGSHREVSRDYKKMYGYGNLISIIFMVIGFFCGIFSVPFFSPYVNLFLFTLLFVFVIFSGVRFGRNTGILVGGSVALSGVLTLLLVTFPLSGLHQTEMLDTPLSYFFFALSLMILPLVGFIAGRVFLKCRSNIEEL